VTSSFNRFVSFRQELVQAAYSAYDRRAITIL
jgi:hypothetical protein